MNFTLLDICDYFERLNNELHIARHFVFGGDEKSVREQIGAFSSHYMFVDFGGIDSTNDTANRMEDSFELAVTIAHPFAANPATARDIVVMQSRLLEEIQRVRRQMLADQRCIPWLKFLSTSHSTNIFVAPDLKRSIGWTLSFNLDGYDIFGVK